MRPTGPTTNTAWQILQNSVGNSGVTEDDQYPAPMKTSWGLTRPHSDMHVMVTAQCRSWASNHAVR